MTRVMSPTFGAEVRAPQVFLSSRFERVGKLASSTIG